MEQEMYKENILDHYKNPRNKQEMERYSIKHTGHNPLCGDKITLFLKVKEGKVVDISFAGEGCAISQASASLLTEFVQGKTLEEVKQLSEGDIYNLLGIPISHARQKCALLSLQTLQEMKK
jgi:nitrogen fixation protein NifU and related proteins